MDPIRNPFAPGAGTEPPELAGRAAVIESTRIALGRVKIGRSAKSQMFLGLRGVGKTVLLNHAGELARRAEDETGLTGFTVPKFDEFMRRRRLPS